MKRTIFSFILLFAVAVPVLMADAICDDLMAEGKQKYNAGQYEKAKSLFQTVIEQCGYSEAQKWVTKCNENLTPIKRPKGNQTFTVNGVSFTMVYVQGGTFTMGATSEQGSKTYDDEKPTHKVTLSDYYIGETEVTQALWQAVMGTNPSTNKGNNYPVEQVSYDDCKAFIRRLNSLTGKKFRLPTEAEWEYAARGGNKSRGYKYAGSNDISIVAWYASNSNSHTHPVKCKSPNELGLYDMSGNVWEWCNDWFGPYSSSKQTNPHGPSTGTQRILRGGGYFYSIANYCRVTCRNRDTPSNGVFNLGLRLAM